MDWKELYSDKKMRPGINELSQYLSADVMNLFSEFANYLASKYDLRCAPAVYTNTFGWTFRFGKSNMYLVNNIYMKNGCFHVEGISVNNKESLEIAFSTADMLYSDGFAIKLAEHCAKKSMEQAVRTKLRKERERKEIKEMEALIKKDSFNKFRWSPKLTHSKLIKLYENDAKMIYDDSLADDVGYTLYTRCMQGKAERLLIETRRIKCHNCGEILSYKEGLIECPCGHQYLFRDYMRSFRVNNMPSGSATHIFNAFIDDWPSASTYSDKMKLIDNLIHEFHINLTSGVKGRFVGINLIEGSKKQISELIFNLAYK